MTTEGRTEGSSTLLLGHIVINSQHPKELAEFYAKLLGGEVLDYGNGYIGINHNNQLPALLFQQSDGTSQQPAWVHLDFTLPEPAQNREGFEAAKQEIMALGGKFIEQRGDSNFRWAVFEDPDGNPFCIPTL